MKNLYVIPLFYAGSGKLPMEYRLFEVKKDMRTKFCKEKADFVFNGSVIEFMNQIKKHSLIVKDNRLIMPDGKTAFLFLYFLRKSK